MAACMSHIGSRNMPVAASDRAGRQQPRSAGVRSSSTPLSRRLGFFRRFGARDEQLYTVGEVSRAVVNEYLGAGSSRGELPCRSNSTRSGLCPKGRCALPELPSARQPPCEAARRTRHRLCGHGFRRPVPQARPAGPAAPAFGAGTILQFRENLSDRQAAEAVRPIISTANPPCRPLGAKTWQTRLRFRPKSA
jgi:hypothetical protein